jgi:hypothetical protein
LIASRYDIDATARLGRPGDVRYGSGVEQA